VSSNQPPLVVKYHLDEACLCVLKEGEVVSSEELRQRLKDVFGALPHPQTIPLVNRQIEIEQGVAPLKVTYELNPEYYEKIGCACKGTPRSWMKYLKQALESNESEGEGDRFRHTLLLEMGKKAGQRSAYREVYRRLQYRPEIFLQKLFGSRTQATVDEIADFVPEFYFGAGEFPSSTMAKLLGKYITSRRGPPYLQEVEPGVYRVTSEPSVIQP
jgi:hypothetical protein